MADISTTGPVQANLPGLGQALIRGRIRSVRKGRGAQGGYLHVIALPAPDEYSPPAVVEVWAAARLGEPEGTWAGRVQISGYARSYKVEETDRDGELRTITVPTADVRLLALGQ